MYLYAAYHFPEESQEDSGTSQTKKLENFNRDSGYVLQASSVLALKTILDRLLFLI